MGIGLSILLIAIGAVLTWAVHFHVAGVSIHLIGIILMIVGAIGLLASLLIFGGDRGPGRRTASATTIRPRGGGRAARAGASKTTISRRLRSRKR